MLKDKKNIVNQKLKNITGNNVAFHQNNNRASRKKQRVIIDITYQEFIGLIKASNNYIFKGITPEIAELAINLASEINQDPADRLILATSIVTNAPLVTADKNLQQSKLKTIW